MNDPINAAPAPSIQGSYEHHRRVIEFNGVALAGWSELTGGGVLREGQANVFDELCDEPRDVTNGRVVPLDLQVKIEVLTWQTLKKGLIIQAVANGDTSDIGYQKVTWPLVDQWRSTDEGKPSVTRTYTVKVKGESPETPNDGGQFYYTIILAQAGLPQETFN